MISESHWITDVQRNLVTLPCWELLGPGLKTNCLEGLDICLKTAVMFKLVETMRESQMSNLQAIVDSIRSFFNCLPYLDCFVIRCLVERIPFDLIRWHRWHAGFLRWLYLLALLGGTYSESVEGSQCGFLGRSFFGREGVPCQGKRMGTSLSPKPNCFTTLADSNSKQDIYDLASYYYFFLFFLDLVLFRCCVAK